MYQNPNNHSKTKLITTFFFLSFNAIQAFLVATGVANEL